MRYFLVVMICWLCILPASAQREWDTWCVGADTCIQAGIAGYGVFNNGFGVRVSFSAAGPVLAGAAKREGVGAFSDAQGNLLFYTNGVNVYDRLNRLLPGGQYLSDRYYAPNAGGALAVRVAIHPVPNKIDRFYLFYFKRDNTRPLVSPNALGILNYAIVDMQANGGYGAVVQRDVALLATNLPKLTIVRHPNNTDCWVVTQGSPNRGFQVFRVSAAGVSPQPIVSLAGEAAYANSWLLTASPDGQQLVSEGNRPLTGANNGPIVEHGLYLYDFDNITGQVSHERLIWRPAPWDLMRTPLDIYYRAYSPRFFEGASFSPDSRLLYTVENRVTQDVPTGGVHYELGTDLVQYDAMQPDAASLQQSRQVLTQNLTFSQAGVYIGRFAGLQLASNGTLWTHDWLELNSVQPFNVCYGPKAMTEIAQPNRRGLACDLRLQAFPLTPNIVDPGILPNVVTNMLFAPTALLAKIDCDSVRLWANSQQTRPPGRWSFDDPGSGAANTVVGYYVAHRFASGGRHRVALTYPDGLVLTRELDVPAGDADFSDANIITPNGDGLNDVFRPVRTGELSSTARLRVFSRWGRLVHEAAGAAPAWPAEGQAEGVYYWLLAYTDCTGQPRQRKGTITVVR